MKNKQTGCDMCGEAKEVRQWKGGGHSNWEKIFLCEDCWEIYRQDREKHRK